MILQKFPVFAFIAFVSAVGFAGSAYLLHPQGIIFKADDPLGYYLYLRSLVHDHDLDFSNELQYFRPMGRSIGYGVGEWNPITQKYVTIYTIGFPLLAAPVYVPVSSFLSALSPHPTELNNFPWFADQILFSYSGLIVGLFGLYISFRFVSLFFDEDLSLSATIIYWSCSPLLYYLIRQPFESHLGSIFAVSLFLYTWKVPSLDSKLRAILMGLIAAIMTMVRQHEIGVVLVPALYGLLSGECSNNKKECFNSSLLFLISFLCAFSVQMLVWRYLFGSFLVYSYRGYTPHLFSPQILPVLFSSNHGLFAWHPIVLFCLIGLWLSNKFNRALRWALLIAFLFQLYLIASWWNWWMGHSFGHRGFLGLTPIFILGLAAFLSRVRLNKWWKIFVPALFLMLLWNGILMLAYLSELIPYEGQFSWTELFRHIPELPQHASEKIRKLRTAPFSFSE
jgi:hypothetical protein